MGLAARYVSGYLETAPPPGEERLVGPTRPTPGCRSTCPAGAARPRPHQRQDRRVDVRDHGLGRDYADVSPLKGIVFGGGDFHTLDVAVDVSRVAPGDG